MLSEFSEQGVGDKLAHGYVYIYKGSDEQHKERAETKVRLITHNKITGARLTYFKFNTKSLQQKHICEAYNIRFAPIIQTVSKCLN